MPMSLCLSCGASVFETAKFCSACGRPLDPSAALRAEPATKWYHNVWFVLFLLFFVLGPFGLPLVWKNQKFSRPLKLVLTVVMVLYTLFIIDVTLRAIRAVTNEFNQLNATYAF